MLKFIKKECIIDTFIVLLIVAIISMTAFNFNQVNSSFNENFCNCSNIQSSIPPIENNFTNINNNNSVNNTSNIDTSTNNKLVLYYATWCGYSMQFMPIWENIKQALETSNTSVICEQHKCDNNSQICSSENIEGFPTLMLIKSNGSKIIYNGPRSVDAVVSFVKNAN